MNDLLKQLETSTEGTEGDGDKTPESPKALGHQMPNPDLYDDPNSGIDDLIPDFLKDAVKKTEEATQVQQSQTTQQTQQPQTTQQPQEGDEGGKEGEENEDDITNLLDEVLGKPEGEGDEGKEPEEEKPFWYEDEDYKKLVEADMLPASYNQESLDSLIQKLVDKKVTEYNEKVTGLETQVADLNKQKDLSDKSISRYKNIEKSAFFDNLPEVQEKFVKPIQENVQNLQQIFEREGVSTTLAKALQAKSINDLDKLLEENDLPKEVYQQITSNWRSYKETFNLYNSEKTKAQGDLTKYLQTGIGDEIANELLNQSLDAMLKSDDKFGYINDVIIKGLDKNNPEHEEAVKVVQTAKSDFNNVIKALSDPIATSRDTAWLGKLADFFFRSAHNERIESKYYDLVKTNKDNETKVVRLATKLRELLDSSRGITGPTSVGMKTPIKSNGHIPQERDIKEEFEALLADDNMLDDILN